MSDVWDGTCGKCGASRSAGNVWYGKLPNKYCKLDGCYALGVERGHITPRCSKRPRSPGESSQAETVVAASEARLVKIDRVYQFRCVPAHTLPCPA